MSSPAAMVIDLTLDSDTEEMPKKTPNHQPTVLPIIQPKLAREVAENVNDHILPSVPLKKRKLGYESDQSSVTSKSTPALSLPSPAAREVQAVQVVIPSPSRRSKEEIEDAERERTRRQLLRGFQSRTNGNVSRQMPAVVGLSEEFYPIDEDEKRARQAAYPRSKRVNRTQVPLPLTRTQPDPLLISKPSQQPNPLHDPLYQTLQRKLASIKGPEVSLAPDIFQMLSEFAANFEFVNTYKIHKDVKPVDESFNGGCPCDGDCKPEHCGCLSLENESDKRIVPYHQSEDAPGLFVLTPDFLKRTSMIFECTVNCECDINCWNRVVQRGRTVRLEIFHTGNRGFGLRSPDWILAGQFIDLYLGEVITKKNADLREYLAVSTNSHSYLFGLDFLKDDEEIYVVDGQNFGSPTRFMNHSCNPNCKMFAVSRNHADERLYDLAFFARRDIHPNVELTFDYNPNWEGSKSKNEEKDPNAVQCLCGEVNCRGQLWPNQRKGPK